LGSKIAKAVAIANPKLYINLYLASKFENNEPIRNRTKGNNAGLPWKISAWRTHELGVLGCGQR